MAGSTAGWWPSDRDRFPPRFLLPPSLQTHNCIISTHLASSSPRRSCPSGCCSPLSLSVCLFLFPALSLPLSLSSSPYPALRVRLSPPPANSPLTSFSIRPGARLRTPLSFDRPVARSTGRFSLFAVIHLVFSPLSRETAHRLFVAALRRDAGYDALACTILPLARSTAVIPFRLPPLPPVCLSFSSPREAEVMTRIRFFILPSPRQPAASPPSSLSSSSSFSSYLVVRSMIGPAIPTGGHATIYPTRRRGQSADRNDGTRR